MFLLPQRVFLLPQRVFLLPQHVFLLPQHVFLLPQRVFLLPQRVFLLPQRKENKVRKVFLFLNVSLRSPSPKGAEAVEMPAPVRQMTPPNAHQ